MSNTPIELKGSSFTLSVVHLHGAKPEIIRQALEDKTVQASAFLKHASVVVNVSSLENPVDWLALQKVVTSTGLRIIGVSGYRDVRPEAEIDETGLPLLAEGKGKVTRPASVEAPAPVAPPQNVTPITKTRLINVPARPGQRIYALQCDLIVTDHVGTGAELIADGNIHAHGMMRGRALAGASGDRETQTSCTHPTAELMSIAGVYWLSDKIPAEFYGKTACLQLIENALTAQLLN